MQIAAISNTNFGRMKLSNVGIGNNTTLSIKEQNGIKALVKYLNNISGDEINVLASVHSDDELCNFNTIKLTMYPSHEIMDVLKFISPEAYVLEYKHKTRKYVLLTRNLKEILGQEVEKHKKYIKYCLMNPEHRKNVRAYPPASPLQEGVYYTKFTDLYR